MAFSKILAVHGSRDDEFAICFFESATCIFVDCILYIFWKSIIVSLTINHTSSKVWTMSVIHVYDFDSFSDAILTIFYIYWLMHV